MKKQKTVEILLDENGEQILEKGKKFKKSKRKERKLRKKRNRLYSRIGRMKKKLHPVAYYPLMIGALVLEIVRKLMKFLLTLCFLCLIAASVLCAIIYSKVRPIYDDYKAEMDAILASSSPEDFSINESSLVLYADGTIMANLHENSDTAYLEFEDIPTYVVDAFVAVEDRTFWDNAGFDLRGIARVAYKYIETKGEEKHGASTITQQLARGTYLTRDVEISRKAKEIILANGLSRKYTKAQIMEFYCNSICFANGIYGIEGASKAYFNKNAKDLTLKQAVYLCAIPNRPEYYNPYKDKDRAIDRCEKILDDMLECGFITTSEHISAMREKITITKPDYIFNNYETTFAVDCATKYLMKLDEFEFRYQFEDMTDYNQYHDTYDEAFEKAKHKLYTGGYRIYTSLDKEVYKTLQGVLDEGLAFNEELDEITGIYKLQGALTCIDNKTRKVVAIVGGRSQDMDDKVYSLNRAYQSFRQPGSTIKPIAVYAPSFELGYTPESIVQNISVDAAKAKDADISSMTGESMVLRKAVELSRNGVAYKLFDTITPAFGMSYLTSMKFSNLCPNDYFNSSALGGLTYGVSTVEMAGAYSTLANHGEFIEPTCVISILDKNGEDIYVDDRPEKVYKSKSADDMVDVLKGVLVSGTGAKLGWYKRSDIEAFAKTGTTNNSKDGWLCGATPYYSIAVWVGYDRPQTLNNLWGATYPGEIWAKCMQVMCEGTEETSWGELEPIVFERDSDDESYLNPVRTGSYYQYLEGRDDSEVLSEGYTVGNYREDRVIGESVVAIANQMSLINTTSPDAADTLNNLYAQGNAIIDTIYSRKYTAEMHGVLDQAYGSVMSQITGIPYQPPTPVEGQ